MSDPPSLDSIILKGASRAITKEGWKLASQIARQGSSCLCISCRSTMGLGPVGNEIRVIVRVVRALRAVNSEDDS